MFQQEPQSDTDLQCQSKQQWWRRGSSSSNEKQVVAVHEEDAGISPQEETPAAAYLRDHVAEWGNYDKQEANKVLRKIDWRLIPLIVGTITIGAIDKSLMSNASLYGMNEDTHLVGQEYNWVISLFHIGWLLAEYPSGAIIQKLPIDKTVSVAVFLWGISVMCLAAAQNAAGLMVLRFAMGVLEAPLFPSVAILNSMWYTKAEQPVRTAWSFTSVYSLITGLVSYGIGHAHTKIANWRLLFLANGALTIVWSIVLFLWLPGSPLSDKFLRGKEKYIALHRVQGNMTGIQNKKLKWYQVREAFTDYKTYLLFLIFFCIGIPGGGLNGFSAQIISGFGYGKLTTVLLGMPLSVILSLSGLIVALPQRRLTNKRCLSAGLYCIIPLVFTVLLRQLPHDDKVGRLISFYLIHCLWGAFATSLSLSISNVSGHTKKLTINGTIFLAFSLANIIAPQTFLSHEAPGYTTALTVIIIACVVLIACLAAYAVGCALENKRRGEREGRDVQVSMDEQFGDLTDYEKKGFRYVY